MRLLFIVDGTFPTLGGAETQARKLARALRERGHEVEFLVPRVSRQQSLLDEVDGFQVKRIDYPHIKLLGGFIMVIAFIRYLLRHGREYDAIHVHITRLLAASAAAVKPIIKRPVIAKISGFYEFNGGVLDESKRFLPVNFLIRRALRNIDFFQTISYETQDKLLAAGYAAEQIRFVPNGIESSDSTNCSCDSKNQSRFDSGQDDKSRPLVFGYCGRLREVKGVHVLLDAFARLVAQHPERRVLLKIAGDGVEMEALQQQCRSLGLDQQVEFMGMVTDTREAYRRFDYYVQPSFAEGLPNSVIEAMMIGLPVIASRVGGNVDLVHDGSTGLLFPAGDAEALSVCLSRCLEEPAELDQMAVNGTSLVTESYSFNTVADQLLELYQGRETAD